MDQAYNKVKVKIRVLNATQPYLTGCKQLAKKTIVPTLTVFIQDGLSKFFFLDLIPHEQFLWVLSWVKHLLN